MVDHFYELLTVCRLGRTILTMMRGWWEEQRRNQGKNYCRGSVKINGYYTPLTPVRPYTRPLHFRRTLQLHCTLSKILVTSRYTVLQNYQQIQTPGTLRNTSWTVHKNLRKAISSVPKFKSLEKHLPSRFARSKWRHYDVVVKTDSSVVPSQVMAEVGDNITVLQSGDPNMIWV